MRLEVIIFISKIIAFKYKIALNRKIVRKIKSFVVGNIIKSMRKVKQKYRQNFLQSKNKL